MENYLLSDEEKKKHISALTDELVMLRTKSGISQENLANYLGISRQTYNAIECKNRKMSWSIYLSLIMYFDYNQKTHKMLRTSGIFPYEIINGFNDKDELIDNGIKKLMGNGSDEIFESLDAQAIRSIRILIMAEYARCAKISEEALIKSFSGINFENKDDQSDVITSKALKNIKERNKNE